jgi:hypothetical protein
MVISSVWQDIRQFSVSSWFQEQVFIVKKCYPRSGKIYPGSRGFKSNRSRDPQHFTQIKFQLEVRYFKNLKNINWGPLLKMRELSPEFRVLDLD